MYKNCLYLIIFFMANLLSSQSVISQEVEGIEEDEQEQNNFGKPIRPVQNSTFYPDEDPDSGMEKCLVADFRYLALNTSDPIKRMKKAAVA